MEKNCCEKEKRGESGGFLRGIFYGIIPHSFCIAFIVFSIIGAVSATALLKKIMIMPYFFEILIILSLIMATVSAVFYLKRNNCLCKSGIKGKWKYLTLLYGITIFTNIFMFYFVLPVIANTNLQYAQNENVQLSVITIKTQIPCAGHSFLIIDELKEDLGVKNVKFKNPNIFEISYNPKETSQEKITSSEICQVYKTTIID